MNSPLAIFAYRRPEHLRRVVESLLENPEAAETNLTIFCDGAKSASDEEQVAAVRRYARTVEGFLTTTVVERQGNCGLSKSITEGVRELCERYGRVAVVEDDVVVSRHFLNWINRALDKYEFDDRVISVGCYVFSSDSALPETFFLNITDCWGWAVWKRSWDLYEPDGTKLLNQLSQRGLMRHFDLEGAFPYANMLREQVAGRNDSWAVRWYATAVLTGGLTVYPGKSMTVNIGFDGTGVHCGLEQPYEATLATRPVMVADIDVAESSEGRRVWSLYLSGLSQRKPITSFLFRMKQWLRLRIRNRKSRGGMGDQQ